MMDQSSRTTSMRGYRPAVVRLGAGSRRMALALVLAGACTVLTLALFVAPASAVIVRVQGGVLSYEPAPNAVSRPSIASQISGPVVRR